MKIPKILICLSLLLILATLSCSQQEKGTVYFVSSNGSDSNSGKSSGKAFATLQQARDAIRDLKQKDKFTSPVTVYLLGGLYELQETFILTKEDSGTEEFPITYCAYQDEKPVISGGRKISGTWTKHEGNIMVCDVPEAVGGKWKFRQLFMNNKRLVKARIPDKGYTVSIEKTKRDLGKSAFKFLEGDIRRWNNLDQAEIVLFHSWNESRLFISDIDEKNRIVMFTGPIGFQLGRYRSTPNQYYVENILEGLDQPGEWYLDYRTGKLYLYPEEPLEEAELRAPVVNQLILLDGNVAEDRYVQYVSFSGLTFTDVEYIVPPEGIPTLYDIGDIYRPSAITFEGTRFCTFENNCIKNTGSYALEITGDGNKVSGNEIYDTGSGGIISRSYGKEPNVISYNHIYNCGKELYSGVGVNIDDGGGHISHNHIHDISQTGVYGRHWAVGTQPLGRLNQAQQLVIEFNEIHDVMQMQDDGGGIMIRDSNIIIRNNLIYNVYSPAGGSPGWGIYLGCETRYTKVENNIVYGTDEGLHVWYGSRHNVIENNIFVDSKIRQVWYQAPENRPLVNNKFIRNIVYNNQPKSALFDVQQDNTLPAESDYNVLYQTGGKDPVIRNSGNGKVNSYDAWLKRGFEKNSIVGDPMFKDPQNNDFTLLPESPALKLGFKPIDISNVGLRGVKK